MYLIGFNGAINRFWRKWVWIWGFNYKEKKAVKDPKRYRIKCVCNVMWYLNEMAEA